MADSLAGRSTQRRTTRSVGIIPANTSAPDVMFRGADSPVRAAVLKAAEVSLRPSPKGEGAHSVPSNGTRSPALTSIMSPTFTSSGSASTVVAPMFGLSSATAAGIVTPEIYHTIMNDVQGSQVEHLFKFAWGTGLRRSEIVALRWSDFDADAALVHVTKARKRAVEEYEGAPKTAYSVRTVTLSPAAVQNLLAWKKKLAEQLLSQGIRLTKDAYIFRSLKDVRQPMTLTALTHIFADLKEKLNLPKNLRFHSFRHTHATMLAEQEISAKKIQVRLGHSSAAFTMDRYVHNTVQMQDGITEKIVKCEEKYSP